MNEKFRLVLAEVGMDLAPVDLALAASVAMAPLALIAPAIPITVGPILIAVISIRPIAGGARPHDKCHLLGNPSLVSPRAGASSWSASVGSPFIALQDSLLQCTSSILQLFCNEPLLLAYLSVM